MQTEAIKILKASPNQRNLIRRFEGKGPAPYTFLVEAQECALEKSMRPCETGSTCFHAHPAQFGEKFQMEENSSQRRKL